MKRIGIISQQMSQGKTKLYYFYVVFLSALISLIIFLLSAFTIIFGVSLVMICMRQPITLTADTLYTKILLLSLLMLVGVVAIVNGMMIINNIRLRKKQE